MEDSLFILVPLSLLLVFAIGLILWWSVRGGQFDDMEGPAYRVLMDDDDPKPAKAEADVEEGEKTKDFPGRAGP